MQRNICLYVWISIRVGAKCGRLNIWIILLQFIFIVLLSSLQSPLVNVSEAAGREQSTINWPWSRANISLWAGMLWKCVISICSLIECIVWSVCVNWREMCCAQNKAGCNEKCFCLKSYQSVWDPIGCECAVCPQHPDVHQHLAAAHFPPTTGILPGAASRET